MASNAIAHGRTVSFKPPYTQRPYEYRTPSPPLRFVEPVTPSPYHPAVEREAWGSTRKRKLYETLDTRYKQEQDATLGSLSKPSRASAAARQPPLDISGNASHRGNHRKTSPSALDVFAAVATSPQLECFSPGIASSYVDRLDLGQRPPRSSHSDFHRASKRTRSETFDLRSSLSGHARPATSHVGQGAWAAQEARSAASVLAGVNAPCLPAASEPQMRAVSTLEEDAELLLGFSMTSRAQSASHQPHGRNGAPQSHQQNSLLYPQPRIEAYTEHSYGQAGHNRYFDNIQRAQDQYHTDYQPGPPSAPQSLDAHHHHLPPSSSLHKAEAISGLQDHVNELVNQVEEVPEKKPRVYRGWPKGKPRGPRKDTGEGKKAKRISTKRTSTTSKPASGHVEDTSSSPDSPLTPDEILKRPRRRSHSGTTIANSFGISPSANTTRSRSVPPEIRMLLRPIPAAAVKPKAVAENICASCDQTKNRANGTLDFWINCNGCNRWFHTSCAGFESERKVKEVDKYFCKECEPKHGPTTFVRKSTRAHASIDYAGLHEGKIRTAVDLNEHHYIKPIKDGKMEFQPETFARMPPELVTAEFFERSGSMTEPILIPKDLNPQQYENQDELEHGSSEGPQEQDILNEDLEYDYVFDVGQDKLDMVLPRGLTVRRVAELYGPEEKVEVIDVKLQEGEDRRWNMRQWADYYETEGEKPVRNVISLEVSQSRLGRLIRRPKIVRDLDLQDAVWPQEESAKGVYPKVQFYCLMSVADAYTDFHIDFGGSSVYYHILKGRKTFFFIPPKAKHLKKYEEWCLSPDQNNVFLGDQTKECYRVDLYPGDTMLIPSGWIHAVWTPENSLVIGGNFLTRMHYGMQIQINEIEKSTGVGRKFRYPYFQKIMWHALIQYLQQDPIPAHVAEHLYRGSAWKRDMPVWLVFDGEAMDEDEAPESFNARYYSQGEVDGLPDLLRYIHRTVLVATGKASGISKTTQEAVMRSMPKGFGDHTELLKTFAVWIAWKRGNETLPPWAFPAAELSEAESLQTERRKSVAATKRSERQAAREAFTANGPKRELRGAVKADSGSHEPLTPGEATSPGMTMSMDPAVSQMDLLHTSASVQTPKLQRFGVKPSATAAVRFELQHEAEAQQASQGSRSVSAAYEAAASASRDSLASGVVNGKVQSAAYGAGSDAQPTVNGGPIETPGPRGPQILAAAKPSPDDGKQEVTPPSNPKQPRRQACMSCRLSKVCRHLLVPSCKNELTSDSDDACTTRTDESIPSKHRSLPFLEDLGEPSAPKIASRWSRPRKQRWKTKAKFR